MQTIELLDKLPAAEARRIIETVYHVVKSPHLGELERKRLEVWRREALRAVEGRRAA